MREAVRHGYRSHTPRRQAVHAGVRPAGQGLRLDVALAGSGHSHFFADRSLALTYAKAWASANRPSKVCVNGAGEGLEHEWIFR